DLLVLPRAPLRDAARLRAVDRARGEAHAQVAEPLLLDHRVRAEALSEGHRELREHAWCRQGDVQRLLPGRAELRPAVHGAARRCVPRERVAEVPPRERAEGVQAARRSGDLMSAAFETAQAGGVIDLFLSMPASKDKQAKKF